MKPTTVHLQRYDGTACGQRSAGRPLVLTSVPSAVTCKACQKRLRRLTGARP